jgi:hypothetical protein
MNRTPNINGPRLPLFLLGQLHLIDPLLINGPIQVLGNWSSRHFIYALANHSIFYW